MTIITAIKIIVHVSLFLNGICFIGWGTRSDLNTGLEIVTMPPHFFRLVSTPIISVLFLIYVLNKTALFVEFTFWALLLNLYIYTSRECARRTYQSLIVHVLYRHVDAFSIKYTTMYIWLVLMELVSSVYQRPSALRSRRKKLAVSLLGQSVHTFSVTCTS